MANIPPNLPKALRDKYSIANNTFLREVKPNPKDRIEVEIGDSKQLDFKPQFKFMRWDNEVNFSLRAEEKAGAIVETQGEKIKYITPDYEVHFYDKPELDEGGFEFEWVLKSKPATNVLTATIETKSLDFFYQPPLTQQEIDEGASRPDNVIGSYAVYHKTKGGMNDAAGMEYKVGKAFHIYRPKVTDANGVETWGELNIDEQNGLLTVTVPQEFLDNSLYPILIDPTFGYTTAGGTYVTYIATSSSDTSQMYGLAGSGYELTESGNVTQVSVGLKSGSGTQNVDLFFAIYREDSAGANSHDLVASAEGLNVSIGTTTSWKNLAFGEEFLSIDDYILAALGNGEDATSTVQFMGDFSGSRRKYVEFTQGAGSYNTRKNEDPWTVIDDAFGFILSIYATYTATGGGTANVSWKSLLGVGFSFLLFLKLTLQKFLISI